MQSIAKRLLQPKTKVAADISTEAAAVFPPTAGALMNGLRSLIYAKIKPTCSQSIFALTDTIFLP